MNGSDVPGPQTLYGALIALQDDALLVPNSAVLEVLSGDRLEPASRPGVLGTLHWRGETIPAASFEVFNGGNTPDTRQRHGRLVVLQALGGRLPGRAWALWSTGYPRMLPVSQAALQPAPLHPDDRADVVLARVRLGVREVAIPDLDRIEAGLLAASTRSE